MERERVSKVHPLKKAFLFVLSWILVAIIGIATLILLLTSIMVLRQNNAAGADVVIALLLSVLLFMVLWLSLRPFKKKLFLKYGRWALLSGALLVFAGVLIGMIVSASQLVSSDASTRCSDIATQFSKAQEATVPLATDLGTGTAFAVNDNSTLLTAYHVIDGAKEIYANYTSGKVNVTILSVAPEFDLVLLRIEKPTPGFLTLTGQYNTTDPVYAYGYPGNMLSAGQASASGGIVSRVLSYEDMKLNSDKAPPGLEMVQTDAALNPGNSGGPLVNRCGVIGVVSSASDTSGLHEYYGIRSEQGIGFAISSRTTASRFNIPINNQ